MIKTKIYRNRLKIIFIITVILIAYNEYISYTLQQILGWPHLICDNSHACVRILFVADPQIIGEQYELGFPLGLLARWDCDRYLHNTFQRAVSKLKPDAIIYLGDLMDEGSIASNEEYERYLKRFFSIFHTNNNIQHVYNPGDNDIGGEGDIITEAKLQRYKQSFMQPSQNSFNNITIYKVNRLLYSMPKATEYNSSLMRSKIFIVVTHMPLLFASNSFVKKVIQELRPQIIFSAHDHKSLHTSAHFSGSDDENIIEALLPNNGPVWKFYFQPDIVHEVMVPTCSYRMGVRDVGYGAAVFDLTDGTVLYAVLWLPLRFCHIISYIVFLVLITINFSLSLFYKLYKKTKRTIKFCKLVHTV